MKYNIFIPYRNRPDSLKILLEKLPESLKKREYITSFNIIIVEQTQEKKFNLGKLLNCGFDFMEKGGIPDYVYSDWDVWMFHPVDHLPIDDIDYSTDYSHSDIGFVYLTDPKYHWGYPKMEIGQNIYYRKINGFANYFYGWGGEDHNWFSRCFITQTNFINRPSKFIYNESVDPSGLPDRRGAQMDAFTELNDELEINKNIYYSGLNTLRYSVVSFEKIQDCIYRLLVKL